MSFWIVKETYSSPGPGVVISSPGSGQGSLPPGLQLLIKTARTNRLSKMYTRGKIFFMVFLLSTQGAVTWYGQFILAINIALPNILIRINECPPGGHFCLICGAQCTQDALNSLGSLHNYLSSLASKSRFLTAKEKRKFSQSSWRASTSSTSFPSRTYAV